MNIKILYDNWAEEGFRSGWGFSALVDDTILFDTGEDAAALSDNMAAFGVRPAEISLVVLSHEDWDHIGGLAILRQCTQVEVYVPASFSRRTKTDIVDYNPQAVIVEVADSIVIDSQTIITPELGTRKKEISLVLRTDHGLVVVTGCAHPGLAKILAVASRFGEVHAVIGGFHKFRKIEILADVSVLIPCHCTTATQKILAMYPKRTSIGAAGMSLDL